TAVIEPVVEDAGPVAVSLDRVCLAVVEGVRERGEPGCYGLAVLVERSVKARPGRAYCVLVRDGKFRSCAGADRQGRSARAGGVGRVPCVARGDGDRHRGRGGGGGS